MSLCACSGVESSAPNATRRVVAALQLESIAPLSSVLNDRLASGTVDWNPPIGGDLTRLLVPADVVEVADTVHVGVSVPIVVNSIGENGCWQSDGGVLTQRGDSAMIVAYDRHSGAAACTLLWTDRLRHEFTTSFPRVGVGIVRAQGRRVRMGSANNGSTVFAERTVVVIP
jgi:hypothetical protein